MHHFISFHKDVKSVNLNFSKDIGVESKIQPFLSSDQVCKVNVSKSRDTRNRDGKLRVFSYLRVVDSGELRPLVWTGYIGSEAFGAYNIMSTFQIVVLVKIQSQNYIRDL